MLSNYRCSSSQRDILSASECWLRDAHSHVPSFKETVIGTYGHILLVYASGTNEVYGADIPV